MRPSPRGLALLVAAAFLLPGSARADDCESRRAWADACVKESLEVPAATLDLAKLEAAELIRECAAFHEPCRLLTQRLKLMTKAAPVPEALPARCAAPAEPPKAGSCEPPGEGASAELPAQAESQQTALTAGTLGEAGFTYCGVNSKAVADALESGASGPQLWIKMCTMQALKEAKKNGDSTEWEDLWCEPKKGAFFRAVQERRNTNLPWSDGTKYEKLAWADHYLDGWCTGWLGRYIPGPAVEVMGCTAAFAYYRLKSVGPIAKSMEESGAKMSKASLKQFAWGCRGFIDGAASKKAFP